MGELLFPDVTKNEIEQVKYPCNAEMKVDGELVIWKDGRVINSYGNDKTHEVMPKYLDIPKHFTLWGELYWEDGKDFYALQKNRGQQNCKVIWFDIVSEGDTIYYSVQPYSLRRLYLLEVTPNVVIAHRKLKSQQDVEAAYEWFVSRGYEGIVVKPEQSLLYNDWVKLKRKKTAKLYVMGIRKNDDPTHPDKIAKEAVSIGNGVQIYCAVSVHGWQPVLNMLDSYCDIIGEDKENYLVEPRVKVEVEYQMLIGEGGKLRNPFIRRVCDMQEDLVLPT